MTPLSSGCKILAEESVPQHFNCMQYAVGNAEISHLFEKEATSTTHKECFVRSCWELGIEAKEVSAEEAVSTDGHYVCLTFWQTDPDRYDYPWDYHVYRIVNREWSHKNGVRGRTYDVCLSERESVIHCDFATFFRLENC